ncbi:hypothetical protein [Longimycelium tulufanense]|uniref:hypothetical protein n=1 Tax=Longimycelium tulufanense TaxID=907463 RepID=UPI0016674C28|nr:hypothetical protein [Longimycelium tulufanense]
MTGPTCFPVCRTKASSTGACWLWGAFEHLRHPLMQAVLMDAWQQIDTSALPVTHPSRVRGAHIWVGPHGLVARFGHDAAHGEWFSGFRLAIRTDLAVVC